MTTSKRPTHPRQLAGLTRRTAPPGAEERGAYGWVGEVPAKVRSRSGVSGTAPTSSVPPVSEPTPDSAPPASAPRRAAPPVPSPKIAEGAEDEAFYRRPTVAMQKVSQAEADEVLFDEEVVLEPAEQPAAPLDDSISLDRLLGIADSIAEELDGTQAPKERPIRVSQPLFSAVHFDPDGKRRE